MRRAERHRDRRLSTRAGLVLAAALACGLAGCLTGEGFGGDDFACTPHFASDRPCGQECDASGIVIVDGDPYCTTTCGEFGECPQGHVCVQLPNSDPDSICLPPCDEPADCPEGFLGICGPERVCGLP